MTTVPVDKEWFEELMKALEQMQVKLALMENTTRVHQRDLNKNLSTRLDVLHGDIAELRLAVKKALLPF